MKNIHRVFIILLGLNLSALAQEIQMDPIIGKMFESANKSDERGLMACFADNASVEIVTMHFKGSKAILDFFRRDVWGGKYTIEKSVKQPYGEDVYLLFKPAGWSEPEPPILYRFYVKNNKIERLVGVYR